MTISLYLKRNRKSDNLALFLITTLNTHPLQIPPRYVIIFTSFTEPYKENNSAISFSLTCRLK